MRRFVADAECSADFLAEEVRGNEIMHLDTVIIGWVIFVIRALHDTQVFESSYSSKLAELLVGGAAAQVVNTNIT